MGEINNEAAANIRLFDLSKAIDAINRDVMRTLMYERGIPSTIRKRLECDIGIHDAGRKIMVQLAGWLRDIKVYFKEAR